MLHPESFMLWHDTDTAQLCYTYTPTISDLFCSGSPHINLMVCQSGCSVAVFGGSMPGVP